LTSAALGAALRRIARKHGYIAQRGPHAGDGNPAELAMALDSGEVATILLEREQQERVVAWLQEQTQTIEDGLLAETLQSLTEQLREAMERHRTYQTEESLN
jgi:hypothetical protein